MESNSFAQQSMCHVVLEVSTKLSEISKLMCSGPEIFTLFHEISLGVHFVPKAASEITQC